MKVLFITRKYPPSTGGMENMAYSFHEALAEINDVKLIAWGGGNKWLPIAFPLLLLRALVSTIINRPDIVYLQDGVMGPMAPIFRYALGIPVVTTVHGLEVTYNNPILSPIYKTVILTALRKSSMLVAISEETKRSMEKIIDNTPTTVIRNGVSDDFYSNSTRSRLLNDVAKELKISTEELSSKKILLTTGRLVERKGVPWFVENALPKLVKKQKNLLYVVCGTGPELLAIEHSIERHNLGSHIKLTGRASINLLKNLYNLASIFVMPNIKIKNDLEGFGLVALEAASCGTLVVASGIEGIKDAIIDGKNGILVDSENIDAYVKTIDAQLNKQTIDSDDIRKYTMKNYSWNKVANEYTEIMQKLIKKAN